MESATTPLLWTLVFLSGFMFVEFLGFASAGLRARHQARARRRLAELARRLQDEESAESILRARPTNTGWVSRLSSRLRLLEPLELLLYRAGRPIGPVPFLALSAALATGGALFANFALGDPRLALPLTALGGLPWLWVTWRKRERMRRFETMLPEALDLLSRALRAGHATSWGLQMVGEELGDPVGPEFAQVAEEVQFGLDLPLALANAAHRIDVPDVPFLVTALLVQRETGGNLAEIIDNLARVIRERHSTYGKIEALTAQTRWSANILLLAPFAFVGLMTMFRPDYIAPLWDTRAGNAMAAAALVFVIAGYALCRRVGLVRV